eukprot:RCo004387
MKTSLIQYFEQELGRELKDEEVEVLAQLSPRGVAKVNTDMFRGVAAADTLRCLMLTAFHQKELQRHIRKARPPGADHGAATAAAGPKEPPRVELKILGKESEKREQDGPSTHVVGRALVQWWRGRMGSRRGSMEKSCSG